MKIQETGFLDLVKDMEKKVDVGDAIEQLAPNPEENATMDGVEYDEEDDPEIERIVESERNKWDNFGTHLVESIASDESAYIASTEHPTYKGFMSSEWGNSKVDEARWDRDSAYILKRTKAGSGQMIANVVKGAKGKSYAEGGAVKTKNGPVGPYETDRGNFDDADEDPSKALAGLSGQYAEASIKGDAEEMFIDMQNIVKNIILGRSDKRHAIIYGDPGIGKTFEVTAICEKYISQSPTGAKYVYEGGDIGTSMSTLVPFFYKHSQNKVIVLDDNDKMIMANLDQSIMNIMKGLLDPKAAETKPITVRANMLKIFQARLEDLEENDEVAGMAKKESHVFEIDAERLREGVCRITIDGEDVVNEHISLQESQDLINMIRPERKLVEKKTQKPYVAALSAEQLYEASNKEFLDDIIGGDSGDDDDEYEGLSAADIKAMKAMKKSGATEQADGDGATTFPRRFLFNSSVIIISNLDLDEINAAVLDRAESIEIKLTLDQYLQRLGNIYGGLCKGSKYSNISQDLRDWAKKCVYTALGIIIEAWKKNVVLWRSPVEINRKFTFRMFDEFVTAWIRYALDRSERVDGKDLSDKKYRDKLSQELLPEVIRRKMLPWMKQRSKI
jgi:hypothetical protein